MNAQSCRSPLPGMGRAPSLAARSSASGGSRPIPFIQTAVVVSINLPFVFRVSCRRNVFASNMKMSALRIALVVGAALSLVPYRTVTVPVWRIRFVDRVGEPFNSLPVTQTWRNYSVETTDHHADGATDKDGYVEFPERELWAPLILRILGPIRSVIGSGAHASFGRSAWIFPKCGLEMVGQRLPTYWGKDLLDRVMLGYSERAAIFHSDPACKLVNEQAQNAANGKS